MTITYEGKTIEFNEKDGTWNYDGRYSNVDVNKVREYIDKEIKSAFQRVEVWDQLMRTVTLTSNPSPKVYWGTCEGNRSKYEIGNWNALFLKTDANRALKVQWKDLQSEVYAHQKAIEALKERQKAIKARMERLTGEETAQPATGGAK